MSNQNALTFKQAFSIVEDVLEIEGTPALLGEPGIGKSSFIEDLARHFKTAVFTLPVNQLADVSDLTGVRAVKSEDTNQWRQVTFPHATIMEAIEHAETHPDEHPILFLDEFNRATPDITSAVLSFTTLRRIGTMNFPDNLRFVVAGNDKGNVNAIDKASTSRFVPLKVKPDVETFMTLDNINPFIQMALRQNPDLIIAEPARNTSTTVIEEDDDSQDFESSIDSIMGEFGEPNNFEQITAPRTIMKLNQWLSRRGIDKSGSQKELDTLSQMISESLDDETSILRVTIEAFIGPTVLADTLIDLIHAHFNSAIASEAGPVTTDVLKNIRPSQNYINTLSRAQNVQDVEDLLDAMSEKEAKEMMIWLLGAENTKEINQNTAVASFISSTILSIDELESEDIKHIINVSQNSDNVSKLAMDTLLDSKASAIITIEPVLRNLLSN